MTTTSTLVNSTAGSGADSSSASLPIPAVAGGAAGLVVLVVIAFLLGRRSSTTRTAVLPGAQPGLPDGAVMSRNPNIMLSSQPLAGSNAPGWAEGPYAVAMQSKQALHSGQAVYEQPIVYEEPVVYEQPMESLRFRTASVSEDSVPQSQQEEEGPYYATVSDGVANRGAGRLTTYELTLHGNPTLASSVL